MGSEIQTPGDGKHVWLDGEDVWPGLAADLAGLAASLRDDPDLVRLPPVLRAASLAEAGSESEYLDRSIALLRRKAHIDTLTYPIPHRPTFAGRIQLRVRRFLWKLLRYQHDRMAFRQNLVNSQVVAQLEFQREAMKRELEELRARVARLEDGSR